MEKEMKSKIFLALLFVIFAGILAWNRLPKTLNYNYPLTKEGLVKVYNEHTLIANIDVDNLNSFLMNLDITEAKKIDKISKDTPLYTLRIYSKNASQIQGLSGVLLTICVYDDFIYFQKNNITYKVKSNLSKNLLQRHHIMNLHMPVYRPILGNLRIVEIASREIGNVGGEPYWRWYGLDHRIEWCCVFVSWAGYQSGYLQAGEIPKFPNVSAGVAFYKDRGKWQGKTYVPSPGDVIFFDLMLDDRAYHVGLVEKVENGRVYTIEGNYNDAVVRRSYPVASPYIYGYGTPNYQVKRPTYLK